MPEAISWLEALRGRIDSPEHLCSYLEEHRLHALFCRSVSRELIPAWLEPLLSRLDQRYKLMTHINTRYFEILRDVLGALDPAHEIFLLKGGDLILRVYKDPGLRPLDDLDLLVRPDQLDRIESILRGLGFEEHGSSDERRHHDVLSRKSLRRWDRTFNTYFYVEIHWALRWMLHRYDTHALRAKKQRIECADRTVNGLHPADLFLYLGLHWQNHWRDKDRLVWACDLIWLIRKGAVPWDHVLQSAREQGLLPALWATLWRLGLLWNIHDMPVKPVDVAPALPRRVLLNLARSFPFWLSLLTGNAFPNSLPEVFRGIRRRFMKP